VEKGRDRTPTAVAKSRVGTQTSLPSPHPEAGAPAPWTLLCAEDTVHFTARERRGSLSVLPSGTRLTIVDDRLLSRWRLRRLARRSGIVIERELIVLPSCRAPIAVVDDVESAVHHFWHGLATVPPGLAATAVPASLVLRVVRSLPWSWTGALAPGRVIVGRRG
jgi:hypothetical protein